MKSVIYAAKSLLASPTSIRPLPQPHPSHHTTPYHTTNPPSPTHSHKYLSLPLLPLSSFLAQHPNLDPASTDEKSLMFARINHELAEREALEQQRQGLLKKKQGLIADNKKRKDDLASLDRELEGFIDVSFLCFLCCWGFFGDGGRVG